MRYQAGYIIIKKDPKEYETLITKWLRYIRAPPKKYPPRDDHTTTELYHPKIVLHLLFYILNIFLNLLYHELVTSRAYFLRNISIDLIELLFYFYPVVLGLIEICNT